MFRWILIIKEDGTYLGGHRGVNKPPCGDPENMSWIEWNKPLPEDINEQSYKLIDNELVIDTSSLLESQKEAALELVRGKKDQILSGGFLYQDKYIQADDDSRSYFSEYFAKRDTIPYPVRWRSLDNTYLIIEDSTTIEEISNQMMLFFGTTIEEYFSIVDGINNSTDENAVDTILNDYLSK